MLTEAFDGITLELITDPDGFSPRRIDVGTKHMMSLARIGTNDKVLDLGCGYGVVGILAAKISACPERVHLIDNDPTAIELCKRNAELNDVSCIHVQLSDGFTAFDETGFTLILCNPPYHDNFATPKHFIEKGFNRLLVGGRMLMVTKRRRWYENKLRAIFGHVTCHQRGDYTVHEAFKKKHSYANAKQR